MVPLSRYISTLPAPKVDAHLKNPRRQQAIGKSKGGLTTKIITLTDKAGKLARFVLKPGNAAEVPELPGILDDVPTVETRELLADKAYDSDHVREVLTSLDIIPTIPPRKNRKDDISYNEQSYKGRHIIENSFVDVKQFRGIATRYCKLAVTYEGLLSLVAWFLGTKENQREISKFLLPQE